MLNTIKCKIRDNGAELSYESTAEEVIMLNDTEFYSLFDKASEAWGWFYVGTMPLKGTPADILMWTANCVLLI